MVAALVAASTAAVVLAGSASAATWQVYEGDMFAGHAYGLQVPAGAQSLELLFDGDDGATAQLALYAPGGARVGVYTLSEELDAASLANPDQGQYVVYVYELGEGALTARVEAEDAPELALAEIPLVREEVQVGKFAQGELDQVITQDLKRAPVFVTLLYEGSARGLDATVSSGKGVVVDIEDETATAFSPGVWTSMKGERAFDASNLDGTLYTVEVHADSFEGRMVLTTLALDLRAPAVPAKAPLPDTHAHPEHPALAAPVPASEAEFALKPRTPLAFDAPAGTLVLFDPAALLCHADEEEASEKEQERESGCDEAYALVSVYAPDDSVLAVVELTDEAPVAELALPVAGEYVAFVRASEGDAIRAKILGATSAPALRILEMESEIVEIGAGSLFGSGDAAEIVLEHAPLDVALWFRDGVGALSSAQLSNEEGVVAVADALAVTPFGPMMLGWSYADPALLAKGEHTLATSGSFEGTLELVSTYYVRGSEVVVEEVETSEEAEEEEADEEEEGSWIPLPAAAPAASPLRTLVGWLS